MPFGPTLPPNLPACRAGLLCPLFPPLSSAPSFRALASSALSRAFPLPGFSTGPFYLRSPRLLTLDAFPLPAPSCVYLPCARSSRLSLRPCPYALVAPVSCLPLPLAFLSLPFSARWPLRSVWVRRPARVLPAPASAPSSSRPSSCLPRRTPAPIRSPVAPRPLSVLPLTAPLSLCPGRPLSATPSFFLVSHRPSRTLSRPGSPPSASARLVLRSPPWPSRFSCRPVPLAPPRPPPVPALPFSVPVPSPASGGVCSQCTYFRLAPACFPGSSAPSRLLCLSVPLAARQPFGSLPPLTLPFPEPSALAPARPLVLFLLSGLVLLPTLRLQSARPRTLLQPSWAVVSLSARPSPRPATLFPIRPGALTPLRGPPDPSPPCAPLGVRPHSPCPRGSLAARPRLLPPLPLPRSPPPPRRAFPSSPSLSSTPGLAHHGPPSSSSGSVHTAPPSASRSSLPCLPPLFRSHRPLRTSAPPSLRPRPALPLTRWSPLRPGGGGPPRCFARHSSRYAIPSNFCSSLSSPFPPPPAVSSPQVTSPGAHVPFPRPPLRGTVRGSRSDALSVATSFLSPIRPSSLPRIGSRDYFLLRSALFRAFRPYLLLTLF